MKDSDLERRREKPLGFILRKNPHNPRWGDMKLYLRSQVKDLALEIWESEEALERAHEERDGKREASKRKRHLASYYRAEGVLDGVCSIWGLGRLLLPHAPSSQDRAPSACRQRSRRRCRRGVR